MCFCCLVIFTLLFALSMPAITSATMEPQMQATSVESTESGATSGLRPWKGQSNWRHSHHLKSVCAWDSKHHWMGVSVAHRSHSSKKFQKLPFKMRRMVPTSNAMPNFWIHNRHSWMGHWHMAGEFFQAIHFEGSSDSGNHYIYVCNSTNVVTVFATEERR